MLDQNNSLLTLAARGTRTTDALKAAVVSEQAKLTWPQETNSVQEGSGEPGCRAATQHPSPAAVGPRSGMGNVRSHCWRSHRQRPRGALSMHFIYVQGYVSPEPMN